jgi:hypothetical protein
LRAALILGSEFCYFMSLSDYGEDVVYTQFYLSPSFWHRVRSVVAQVAARSQGSMRSVHRLVFSLYNHNSISFSIYY